MFSTTSLEHGRALLLHDDSWEMTPPTSAVSAHPAVMKLKAVLGVHHNFLDQWLHNFLENKNFDVDEALQKLDRRRHMEDREFANYHVTESMRTSMSTGVLQLLPGPDKDGYPVVYIVTSRDHPTADQRDERRKNMDMWLTYVTRITADNTSCQVTWLINQKDSSLWANTDLTFQREMITRIAKYFPGAQHRVYVCNMSNSLSFVLKPLIRAAPASIRDSVVIMSEGDVRDRKLLQFFDRHVLPVALGGDYNGDHEGSWTLFASQVADYTARVTSMLRSRDCTGLTIGIKEWEVREAFGVDNVGNRIPSKSDEGRVNAASHRSRRSSGFEAIDAASQGDATATEGGCVRDRSRSPILDSSLRRLVGLGDHREEEECAGPSILEREGDPYAGTTSAQTPGSIAADLANELRSALHRQTISWLRCGAACRYQGRVSRVHQFLDQCHYLAQHGNALADLFHSATGPSAASTQSCSVLRDSIFLFGASSGRCLLPEHHRTALVSELPRMTLLALNLLYLYRVAGERVLNSATPATASPVAAEPHSSESAPLSSPFRLDDALELLKFTLPSSPCGSIAQVNALIRHRCAYLHSTTANFRTAAALVGSTSSQRSPDMLLDGIHLSAAQALDSISATRSSLHFLRATGERVLRIWHPQVCRADLLCELRRKLDHLWNDQLCSLGDAYEDHQAALSVLQYAMSQRGSGVDSSAALLGLREGFCNRSFLELHDALLRHRRCKRRSFLFHLFPPVGIGAETKPSGCATAPDRGRLKEDGNSPPPATAAQRILGWLGIGSPDDNAASGSEDDAETAPSRSRPTLQDLCHALNARRFGVQHTPEPNSPLTSECTDVAAGGVDIGEGGDANKNLKTLVCDMERVDGVQKSVMESVFAVQRRLSEGRYHVHHLLHRYRNAENAVVDSDGELCAMAAVLKEVVVLDAAPVAEPTQADVCVVPMDSLMATEVLALTRIVARMEYPSREYLATLAAERFLELADDTIDSPAALQEWLWSLDSALGNAWDHHFAGAVQALVAISETSMKLHDDLSFVTAAFGQSSMRVLDNGMRPPSVDFLDVVHGSASQVCTTLEGAVSVLVLATGFSSMWDGSPFGVRSGTMMASNFHLAKEGVCANSVVGQFLFALEGVSDALVKLRELSVVQPLQGDN